MKILKANTPQTALYRRHRAPPLRGAAEGGLLVSLRHHVPRATSQDEEC